MDKFASIREAEMHEIVENIDAANTKKQTNTAVRTFREYLTSKHMSVDFESLSLSLLC
jgi:formylmethanofuran dehydrogenase subunit E-like metal-binding protein